MGVFLHHDAGIINFGPQLIPLGECDGFGLAGKAQKVELQEDENHFSLSYQCRLSAPSGRETGLSHLKDSGYSAQWMEAALKGDLHSISLNTLFKGVDPSKKLLFTFFGKGKACFVAGSHKLNPGSLHRYQGPAQPLIFLGERGGVHIEALSGSSHMEVIPLAGDTSFWGADFLAAYILSAPEVSFRLVSKSQS